MQVQPRLPPASTALITLAATLLAPVGCRDETPAPDRSAETADTGARFALIVGIDDYPGSRNDLVGPVADARIIRDILVREYGFDPDAVLLLLDEDGNRERIIEGFTRHLGQAGPDDVALFFYSGHGVQMDGNLGVAEPLDPERDGRDEALAVRGDRGSSIILDDELGFLADRLEAGRTLVLIDACYSGTGTRGAMGQPKAVSLTALENLEIPASFLGSAAARPPARGGAGETLGVELGGEPRRHMLLSAAADDEIAYTADGWPEFGGVASVFTYFLARGLRDAPPDLTFEELGARIREQALGFTRENRFPSVQTVQVEGVRRTERVRMFLGGAR